MEDEYSQSISGEDLSVSIMSLQPAQDSDVVSLFRLIESDDERPAEDQGNGTFKRDAKGQDQKSQGAQSIRGIGDREKGYYSECNDQEYRPRRRQTRITNLNDRKNKKRRTRAYIEMLENRIQELSNELEKLRNLNRMNKDYIKKISCSQQVVNGLFIGKQQIYEKIQAATLELDEQLKTKKIGAANSIIQNSMLFSHGDSVKNKSFCSESAYHTTPSEGPLQLTRNESKLMELIRNLRQRQGVFGSDRTKAINYYFREMVELLLPDVQKYLTQTILENSDIYSPEYLEGKIPGHQEWRKQMLTKMDLSQEQVVFIQSLKAPFMEQKQRFDALLQTFYETKCRLSEQARKMEAIFDKFSLRLTPLQIGKSLCYIEKYRFQKGISVIQHCKEILIKLQNQDIYYKSKDVGLFKV